MVQTVQPTQALVWPAHDYEPSSKRDDPHGHDEDCECSPKCKHCGSAPDAFIHTEEAKDKAGTLTVRTMSHADFGYGEEEVSGLRGTGAFEAGGNGAALIVPGVDTRIGTDLETQEPYDPDTVGE